MRFFTMVEKDTCIACGVCGVACPEVYDYDDDGVSESILDDNKGNFPIPSTYIDDVLDAYEACPSESIKVAKKPFDGNPEKNARELL